MDERSFELSVSDLQKQINDLAYKLKGVSATHLRDSSRSADLKDLFGALAKAQAEMMTAGLRSENPYFKSKYADLAEIVRVSRPALTKNGLSVIQQILPNDDGQNILHTILTHASGQWIESRMRILPSKPDVQSLASYITYLRRYSYAALCGIVASHEDDDAEVAVATDRDTFAKGVAINTKYNPREESYESISADQMSEINYELADYPDIAEQVLDGLKIQNLSDMPKSKYHVSMKRIREIKNARNGIK
jgi:hypothetical protein